MSAGHGDLRKLVEWNVGTDRPLDQLSLAAIYHWATGDFPDRDVDDHDEEMKGYWSDEDKRKVEELSSNLVEIVEAALKLRAWHRD